MNLPLVHIGMASIPERSNACLKTIHSILEQNHQCFKLWVSLNGHKSIPADWPQDNRITYRLTENELGDAEKFYPVNEEESDLLFTIDDDILYPKNYVATLLQWFMHLNGCHALAIHGAILTQGFKTWLYDRWVSHFADAQEKHIQMHILGTGTTLFNKTWFEGYNFAEWRNMSDIGTSLHLRKKGIARLTIPRFKGWLQGIPQITPICYSPSNLDVLDTKLKGCLNAFQTEVKCPEEAEEMKSAIRHLPRNKRKGGHYLGQSVIPEPKPVNTRLRSRIATINSPITTTPNPRRKRI